MLRYKSINILEITFRDHTDHPVFINLFTCSWGWAGAGGLNSLTLVPEKCLETMDHGQYWAILCIINKPGCERMLGTSS